MALALRRTLGVAALGRRAMSAASLKATTRLAKRPPPKAVLSLTDEAAKRVKDMLKEQPDAIGLRVGVVKGGCSGKSFELSYAYDSKAHEEVVKDKGVTIVVESTAIMNILHSTMDYESKDESEGFVFENPQAKGACGCGASFLV